MLFLGLVADTPSHRSRLPCPHSSNWLLAATAAVNHRDDTDRAFADIWTFHALLPEQAFRAQAYVAVASIANGTSDHVHQDEIHFDGFQLPRGDPAAIQRGRWQPYLRRNRKGYRARCRYAYAHFGALSEAKGSDTKGGYVWSELGSVLTETYPLVWGRWLVLESSYFLTDFKSKKIRVNLNMPIKSEQKAESADVLKTVDEDRRLLIQAVIVRYASTCPAPLESGCLNLMTDREYGGWSNAGSWNRGRRWSIKLWFKNQYHSSHHDLNRQLEILRRL